MGHLSNPDPNTNDSQWDLLYKIARALRNLVTGGGGGSSGGAVSNATSASTAQENSRLVVAGADGLRLFDIQIYNNNVADQWIQVFDSAIAPANGAVPSLVLFAPAQFQAGFSWPTGRPFTAGIYVCNSTTDVTKTLGAADCLFDINYRS